jgi:hypothetical protein
MSTEASSGWVDVNPFRRSSNTPCGQLGRAVPVEVGERCTIDERSHAQCSLEVIGGDWMRCYVARNERNRIDEKAESQNSKIN